jgi:ubiquinone/menaquinone biosynthesis C-methylase UbiE
MLHKAVVAGRRAGEATILYCCGDAGRIPVATASVDVVLVNGIFNLNPGRGGLFLEMARVLKPGGRAFAAELVFTRPQPAKTVRDIKDWLS